MPTMAWKSLLPIQRQTMIGSQNINLGDLLAPGHLPVAPACQLAVSVDAGANQGNPEWMI